MIRRVKHSQQAALSGGLFLTLLWSLGGVTRRQREGTLAALFSAFFALVFHPLLVSGSGLGVYDQETEGRDSGCPAYTHSPPLSSPRPSSTNSQHLVSWHTVGDP